MQEDEPRRHQPRSQSATATEALNSTPDTFMEQQHLTLSAYRGHPAGELRPHPMSQEVVSTRHQTSVTACPVIQRPNMTPRVITGQQNPMSPQSVQGHAPGAVIHADPLRYAGPFSLTHISIQMSV